MNIKALGFLVMSAVCFPAHAFITLSAHKNAEYVDAVRLAVQKVWPRLNTVWGTDIYNDLRLVMADKEQAWAIDSKSIISIPYEEIKKRSLPVEFMYFKKIDWSDKRPTLFVSMGEFLPTDEGTVFRSEGRSIPFLFNLATHEAFHYFVQDNIWKKAEGGKITRATPFPLEATPRLYRNSIIHALYASLRGEPDGLAHARYWYELWMKHYPEEVMNIRQTDIDEGTARYVELSAEVMAKDAPLDSPMFDHLIMEKLNSDGHSLYTSADSESYIIGAMAGFILNREKINWQPRVISGKTPLELIMENVSPVKQAPDRNLEKKLDDYSERENKLIRHDMIEISKNYRNPKIIKFFISSNNSGSMSVNGGFYRIKEIPHDVILGLSMSGRLPYGHYAIKNMPAVSVDGRQGKNGGIMVFYNEKLPGSVNGRLHINTKNLFIDIPYPSITEKNRIISVG